MVRAAAVRAQPASQCLHFSHVSHGGDVPWPQWPLHSPTNSRGLDADLYIKSSTDAGPAPPSSSNTG